MPPGYPAPPRADLASHPASPLAARSDRLKARTLAATRAVTLRLGACRGGEGVSSETLAGADGRGPGIPAPQRARPEWRRRQESNPPDGGARPTRFEDEGGHQAPFTSGRGLALRIERLRCPGTDRLPTMATRRRRKGPDEEAPGPPDPRGDRCRRGQEGPRGLIRSRSCRAPGPLRRARFASGACRQQEDRVRRARRR